MQQAPERRRHPRDPHLMTEAEWRTEVLRQFKTGNDRFDQQDKILQAMEGWVALHALGKLSANAIVWLLKVGAWAAAIYTAVRLGGKG